MRNSAQLLTVHMLKKINQLQKCNFLPLLSPGYFKKLPRSYLKCFFFSPQAKYFQVQVARYLINHGFKNESKLSYIKRRLRGAGVQGRSCPCPPQAVLHPIPCSPYLWLLTLHGGPSDTLRPWDLMKTWQHDRSRVQLSSEEPGIGKAGLASC